MGAALALGWLAIVGAGRQAHRLWPHAAGSAAIVERALSGGFHPAWLSGVLGPLLALTFFFAAAALAGRALLEPFPRAGWSRAEEVLFSLGLGLGCFSLMGLALGLLGLFSPAAIRVVFALVAGASLCFHASRAPEKRSEGPSGPAERGPGPLALAAFAVVAALALVDLAAALGPEVRYDALVYHLALPKLYLLSHRLVATPHNVYAGIPFNTEMLYGLGMALGGEALAKLIPWGLGLAIVAAIAAGARRLRGGITTQVPLQRNRRPPPGGGRREFAPHGGANFPLGGAEQLRGASGWDTAALAALFFYGAPLMGPQVWHAHVELYWCFLALLALFSLLIALEQETLDRRSLVLSGIFAGLAMGVKYNAAGILPILLAPLLARGPREGRGARSLREAFWLALPALLVMAPWLAKNWLQYRNPVFPFLHDSLTGQAWPDWRGLASDAMSRDLKGAFTTASGFLDLFTSLWRRDWTTIDSMGTAFVMLLPWLFLVRRECSFQRRLFLALVVSWLVWAASTRQPRFFFSALPLLSLLLAEAVTTAPAGPVRAGVIAAALCGCLVDAHQRLFDWQALAGWRVTFGQMSRDEYLSHPQSLYPTPYFAAAQAVNRGLPADAKVLLLEEARGYYLERPFIAASAFGRNPLIDIVEGARSPEDVRDGLDRLGVTHLLVNRGEIVRKGHAIVLSSDGARVFDLFAQKYLTNVFEKKVPMGADYQDVGLYAVARPRS